MKLKFNCLLLLLFSNLIFSQSKEYTKCYTIEYNDTFNGNIKNSIYSCKMFDWKIKIPLRYHVMHLKAIEELNKWGIEAVATPNSNPNSYNFKRDPYYLINVSSI